MRLWEATNVIGVLTIDGETPEITGLQYGDTLGWYRVGTANDNGLAVNIIMAFPVFSDMTA
jgi:hypothetical protein